ncbi:hypothetical protein V6N13_103227 [Hibiscus sabdariffa]
MERYKISIGDQKWHYSYDDEATETSRMLKLGMNKIIHLVDGIKHLLRKTQSLYLNGMEDVEEMRMLYHPNVETIGQLRLIEVNNCNMMRNLFSFSIAKRLCQLEGLEVYNCENITELIEEKEEIDDNDILEFNKLRILKLDNLNRFNGVIEGTLAAEEEEGISSSIKLFPKLDSLSLGGLPKLKRFGCAINPIEFPSLKSLNLQTCHALSTFTFDDDKSIVTPSHYLFDGKVNFPALEILDIRGMDNLERLWADQLVEHSFSKLTSIDLRDCPKLLNVFPLSMLTRLQRLERLEICNCESVEEIISEGGSSSSSNCGMPSLSSQFIQSFEFSNLTSLELYNLPNLKSIHHNKMHTMNWPSLKQMTVWKCHRVEMMFANSGETSSQQPLFWVNEVSS